MCNVANNQQEVRAIMDKLVKNYGLIGSLYEYLINYGCMSDEEKISEMVMMGLDCIENILVCGQDSWEDEDFDSSNEYAFEFEKVGIDDYLRGLVHDTFFNERLSDRAAEIREKAETIFMVYFECDDNPLCDDEYLF